MNSPEEKSSHKDSRLSGLPHSSAGPKSAADKASHLSVVGQPESSDNESDEKFIPRISEVRSKRRDVTSTVTQEWDTRAELSGAIVDSRPDPGQTGAVPVTLTPVSVGSHTQPPSNPAGDSSIAPLRPDLASASLAIEMLATSSFDCDAVSSDAAASQLPNMESLGTVDVQELGFHRHISEVSRFAESELERQQPSSYYDALVSQNAIPVFELLPSSGRSNQDISAHAVDVSVAPSPARPSTYWVVDEARLVTHGAFVDFSEERNSKGVEKGATHTMPIADIEEALQVNAIPVSISSAGPQPSVTAFENQTSPANQLVHSGSSLDPQSLQDEQHRAAEPVDQRSTPTGSISNSVAKDLSIQKPHSNSVLGSNGIGRDDSEECTAGEAVGQGAQTFDLSEPSKRSSTIDTGPLPALDSTTHSGNLRNSSPRVKSPFLERAIGNAPPVIGDNGAQEEIPSIEDQPENEYSSENVGPIRSKKDLWKKRGFTAASVLILCIAGFALMYDTVKSGPGNLHKEEAPAPSDEALSPTVEPEATTEKVEATPGKKVDPKEALKFALNEEKDKNYAESLAYYNAAVDARKTVKALHGRGRVLNKLQRYDDALKDLELAAKISPTNQDVTIDLAAVRYMLNDFDGAVKEYNRILSVKPDDPDALYGRGISLAGSKDDSAAIKDFESVVKLRPTYQPAYKQMCTTYMEMGHNDKAEAAITVALTACGEEPDLYFSRGLARYRMGHNADGLEDYNRAIKLDPKRKEFYNDRGYVLMQLGKNDEATSDFEKALEIDPNYVLASENLAKVKSKLEK
ncbi:MAG: tetratricopeptide repeat protein [Candidatus Obscuribacterales bacterium]|nr:tetratricopeptide repeat protein [Candidatus Obscuribacterales bacterium]